MGKARRKRRRERRKARRAKRRIRRREKGGSWFGRAIRNVGKVVGKAAQIVGPIASILPMGGVIGNLVAKGGKALEKASIKLAPIQSKLTKVTAVLGESRIAKMADAVDRKGFVNLKSIENTLKAKGIAASAPIVNDVKSVLQKVIEVKKEVEEDAKNGDFLSRISISSLKAATKSEVTEAKVSTEAAQANQMRAKAVYGVSAPSRDLINPDKRTMLEQIKFKIESAYAWVKLNPKLAALYIGLPFIVIGGVIVYLKRKPKRGKRR
ncbi:hypothetical protein [Labilibacter marinus]|uniref:hypothetical protein n=1 Tax=Labilibacter marinus TaxID=1477105 RepID=UPI0008336A1C|nr:hypothetical protein [Labilibacter marinus]